MAILTLRARANRAMEYKKVMEEQTMWFGFGRKTPWANDDEPPTPKPATEDIEEPIGYKKTDMITFVKQDDEGPIFYLGDNYSAISDEEAIATDSTLLYVRCTVNYTELPPTTYREIGIFRGLKPITAKIASKVLLPSEVEDRGTLDIIDNLQPSSRAQYQRDEYSYMIQF